MAKQMDKIITAYKNIVQKYSLPTSGCILNSNGSNLVIRSTWSQRNIERKMTVCSELTQFVNLETKEVSTITSTDISSELLTSYSPSSTYRALFREIPASGKSPKKQLLEVWEKNFLWKQYDLNSFEIHGDVYTDSEFSCFQWSPCETKILYIAEKKQPKAEPFLPAKHTAKPDEETKKGYEYELLEDWGEQLSPKSSPVVCVCDLQQDLVSLIQVDSTLADHSLGQAVWAPDGGVVCVAWPVKPRRLGLIFCTNRSSWIVHIASDGVCRKLSADGMSVKSPKFSGNMSTLVWLEREVGGPHHACHRLVSYDWASEKSSVVVDIVKDSIPTVDGQQFYGLFNQSLNGKCWLPDNKTIVLSTIQRASNKTYLIDTVSGEVSSLSEDGDDSYSLVLLTVHKDLVMCCRSSLDSPPSLLLMRLGPDNKPGEWLTLVEQEPVFTNYKVGVLRLEARADPEPVSTYSVLYMVPKDAIDAPCILLSHGGPHAGFTNSFGFLTSLFALLGFGIVMPNYRGSVGSGENSVNFQPGRVGKADVQDSQQAFEAVLNMFPSELSRNKSLLFGGSYGGFLSLHLAAQFPTFYRALCIRNPVVDLASAFSTSDIPDWAIVEGGFSPYTFTTQITTQMYEKMISLSPITIASSVVAPTLFLLGKKDLRVPMYQGLNFYYQLKANGIKTRALIYDDNHSLSQVAHEVDLAINSILWFLESIDHVLE